MAKHGWRTVRLAAAMVPTLWTTGAWAQANQAQGAPDDPAPGGNSAANATSSSGGGKAAGGTTVIVKPQSPPVVTTTTTYQPWGLPPPSAGGSKSHDPYAFSLGQHQGPTTVHGSPNASFILTGRPASVPPYHVVRRGDTLWDLCDHYYGSPWMWPKLWSYNPQIENPHWIYPGDRLRLRPAGSGKDMAIRSSLIDRRRTVPAGTVFLRDRGYIGQDKKEVWGELVGSPNDQMLLSEGNEVYLSIGKNHHVEPGRELTLFRKIRRPEKGQPKDGDGHIVEILGTVRIDEWNPKTRIARGRITESLDVIERGTWVGPLGRRFDVVPPVPNDREVKGMIMGAIRPRELIGQHQLVFIDKGSEDGLRPGNRLFVIEKGDRWNKSSRVGKMSRLRVHYELKKAEVDQAPDTLRGKEKKLPTEVVGEIRVLRTKKHSSTCLVTYSEFEIEPGQTVIARRGY